jgi:hypothetical protein
MMSKPILRASRFVATVAILAGCSGAPAVQNAESAQAHGATPSPGEPTIAEVIAATERFRDVKVALTEGYVPDPSGMCHTAEMEGRPAEEGGMGIHYFRPDLLGITGPPNPRVSGTGTHTDFRRPAVLIYEPQADGSLELVAVENLVFIDAWERAGNRQPPSFHGILYDRMEDDPATEADEAHGFESHYDRHVWIYRDNSDGIFAPFNPNVSCKHHGHTAHGNDDAHRHP